MKTPSEPYIAKEEAPVRKPLELYKIWAGASIWYYTNGDAAVVFDGHTYEPATIGREGTEYESTLDVTTLKVKLSGITEPIIQYIAQNPIDITWIEISRLFRDQTPLEKSIIFIGQIKSVSFKGAQAEAECVGFEHFLKMQIPVWRFQPSCNHQVFDAGCALTAGDYAVAAVVTLDSTNTILTSAAIGGQVSGYFTGGLATFENERRTIVAHSGDTVTLNFKMIGLESGDTVTLYPGCDGRIDTCRDTYDNVIQFLGFPFIPEENPARRMP